MLSQQAMKNPRSFIYEQQLQNQQTQTPVSHSYQHKTTSFQKCQKCNLICQQSESKLNCLCLYQSSTNNIQNSIQFAINKNQLILQPKLIRITGQALQKKNYNQNFNQNHHTNCSEVGQWNHLRGCAYIDDFACNKENKSDKIKQKEQKMVGKHKSKANISLNNCYAIYIVHMLSICVPKIPLIPKLILTTILLLTLYLPASLTYTIFILLYLILFCLYLFLSTSMRKLRSMFYSLKAMTRNKPKFIQLLAVFLYLLVLPVLFCGFVLVGLVSRTMWAQLGGVLAELGFCYGEAWVIRNLVFG